MHEFKRNHFTKDTGGYYKQYNKNYYKKYTYGSNYNKRKYDYYNQSNYENDRDDNSNTNYKSSKKANKFSYDNKEGDELKNKTNSYQDHDKENKNNNSKTIKIKSLFKSTTEIYQEKTQSTKISSETSSKFTDNNQKDSNKDSSNIEPNIFDINSDSFNNPKPPSSYSSENMNFDVKETKTFPPNTILRSTTLKNQSQNNQNFMENSFAKTQFSQPRMSFHSSVEDSNYAKIRGNNTFIQLLNKSYFCSNSEFDINFIGNTPQNITSQGNGQLNTQINSQNNIGIPINACATVSYFSPYDVNQQLNLLKGCSNSMEMNKIFRRCSIGSVGSPNKERNSENTDVLKILVKVDEKEVKMFKIRRYDDMFNTVKVFCEINKMDTKLIRPFIIHIMKALNSIYGIYNLKLTDEEIERLVKIREKYNKEHKVESNKQTETSDNNK